jgi:hypothetical protein
VCERHFEVTHGASYKESLAGYHAVVEELRATIKSSVPEIVQGKPSKPSIKSKLL